MQFRRLEGHVLITIPLMVFSELGLKRAFLYACGLVKHVSGAEFVHVENTKLGYQL